MGRRLGDPGVKPTVRVGEAAMREVAAYLLDAAYGHFCRVPPTVLVKARARWRRHRPAAALAVWWSCVQMWDVLCAVVGRTS